MKQTTIDAWWWSAVFFSTQSNFFLLKSTPFIWPNCPMPVFRFFSLFSFIQIINDYLEEKQWTNSPTIFKKPNNRIYSRNWTTNQDKSGRRGFLFRFFLFIHHLKDMFYNLGCGANECFWEKEKLKFKWRRNAKKGSLLEEKVRYVSLKMID